MIPTAPTVGERIRAARLERRMTQRELGRKLGVPYQSVQRYERRDEIPLTRLFTIGEVLRVDISWLVAGIARETAGHRSTHRRPSAWRRHAF